MITPVFIRTISPHLTDGADLLCCTQTPQRPQHPYHQYNNDRLFEAALRNSPALLEVVQDVVAGVW